MLTAKEKKLHDEMRRTKANLPHDDGHTMLDEWGGVLY